MIEPSRIDKALTFIFKALRNTTKLKDPIISVQHTTKAKTRIGGCTKDKLYDRTAFYTSKIENCMRSLVKLRIYSK